jgi:hypothetical protein
MPSTRAVVVGTVNVNEPSLRTLAVPRRGVTLEPPLWISTVVPELNPLPKRVGVLIFVMLSVAEMPVS